VKVLAFLQNQWFTNPERMAVIYARHGGGWDGRAELNGVYLFFRCLTGRRLLAAFGDDARNRIIWENASPKLAGKSDGAFPADIEHMAGAIRHHMPDVVLTFGRIATDGLAAATLAHADLRSPGFRTYSGPHPAARHATVAFELKEMAAYVRAVEAESVGAA
jgi:hypothetical protein